MWWRDWQGAPPSRTGLLRASRQSASSPRLSEPETTPSAGHIELFTSQMNTVMNCLWKLGSTLQTCMAAAHHKHTIRVTHETQDTLFCITKFITKAQKRTGDSNGAGVAHPKRLCCEAGPKLFCCKQLGRGRCPLQQQHHTCKPAGRRWCTKGCVNTLPCSCTPGKRDCSHVQTYTTREPCCKCMSTLTRTR